MKASMFMLMLLCICAAILTSLMLYSGYKSENDRGVAYEKLENRAASLQDQVTKLLEEQGRLSEELRESRRRADATQSSNTETNSAEITPAPFRQEFYAKAFLDGDYVGLARVTPVFHEDEKTGQVVFENVINLSGDARKSVIKTVTNTVERDVVRNTTLNNNYSTSPYWYAYPAWVRPNHTNRPPGQPTPTPPIARPTFPNSGNSQWKTSSGAPIWQNGQPYVPKTLK